MKRITYNLIAILLLSLVTTTDIYAKKVKKSPDDYRETFANEAVIHDWFAEVVPLEKLPTAYKKVIEKMGMSEDDIHFYTAVRMGRFTEKVGNCIVLCRPNFFIYLTEEEQVAQIAQELYRIRSNDMSELRQEAAKSTAFWHNMSILATGVGLAACYRYELQNALSALPSKIEQAEEFVGRHKAAAALLALCTIFNVGLYTRYYHSKVAAMQESERAAFDTAPEALLKTLDRQITWEKNKHSWIGYQWKKLVARLGLCYSAEVQLEKYKELLAEKKNKN